MEDANPNQQPSIKVFFSHINYTQVLSILGVLVLIAAIPLTVFLSQQRQTIEQQAITLQYQAMLTASQVVPPTSSSTATGTSIITLQTNGSAIVSLTIQGPTLLSTETGAHIHGPALPGSNAPILIILPLGQFSSHQILLTATEFSYLQQGKLYIDIHSQSNPNGAIRGQYQPIPNISPSSTPLASPSPTLVPNGSPTPTHGVSPTPTAIPTPTLQPTFTPTPKLSATPTPQLTIVPTPTILPTLTPLPTPVPVSGDTLLGFDICPHGLGDCGDNVNPKGGNKNPHNTQKLLTALVYNTTNQLVASVSGLVTYVPSTGRFNGTIDVGKLPTGTYIIRIQVPQYLHALVPGIQQITAGQMNLMPTTTLVTGDIDGDNRIDISDYNILISCYNQTAPTPNCTQQQLVLSDLTDDGYVDLLDYNQFIRELSTQQGQ